MSHQSNRKIPLDWIKHLKSEEQRKEFEGILRNSTRTLRRLSDLLDEYVKEEEHKQQQTKGYDQAGWAYKQADHIGTIRTLKKIKDLVSFIER